MASFPVFLDTCVLYPAYLCDTLLRLAETGTYRPLWPADVLRELRRNLVDKASLAPERADRRIRQMKESFPDAEVLGYESMIDAMSNDPKDRHVLAAAVRAGAEVIVTANLKDFPGEALAPYDLVAVHPDNFLLDQLDLYRDPTIDTLRQQADDYAQPPRTLSELLACLGTAGVPRFFAEVRRQVTMPNGT